MAEVGDYLLDRPPAQRGEGGIGDGVVRDERGRLVQGDAPGPGPGAVIDVEGVAEGGPPGGAEHRPGRDDVGRGIAGARAAEVDDGTNTPAGYQQVGPQQVGVDPRGPASPGGRLEGGFPGGQGAAETYAVAPPGPARVMSLMVTEALDEERARGLRARGADMDWDQALAYTLTQTTQALSELESGA